MIEIAATPPGDYQAALELLFHNLAPHQARESIADVLNALRVGRISLHGLLTARVAGVMVGSILYILQVDRTAFVWPPGVNGSHPGADGRKSDDEIADALALELIRRIESAGAWIGQCLINPDWREQREILSRNGLEHLTDLRFLARMLDDRGAELPADSSPDARPLESVAYQPGVNDARFARLLEQTYVGTQDCPEVGGRRSGEQAIIGHRMSGDFDPSRWKLFQWEGQDAAVLLMNAHAAQQLWEVVYTGVAHSFRGHGLGRRILLEGLRGAQAAGQCGVALAVDCRNKYASKIYDDLGFVETDRKSVHVYLPKPRVPVPASR